MLYMAQEQPVLLVKTVVIASVNALLTIFVLRDNAHYQSVVLVKTVVITNVSAPGPQSVKIKDAQKGQRACYIPILFMAPELTVLLVKTVLIMRVSALQQKPV